LLNQIQNVSSDLFYDVIIKFAFGLVQRFLQDGLVKLVKMDVDRSHDLTFYLCVCKKSKLLRKTKRETARGQR